VTQTAAQALPTHTDLTSAACIDVVTVTTKVHTTRRSVQTLSTIHDTRLNSPVSLPGP
jgi:hypothetical protein